MERIDILGVIMIAFIIILCLKIYSESDAFNLKCIISDVDSKTYCVRERPKLELAADLLAQVAKKCKILVNYVDKKYPEDEDIQRLVENFNPTKISETLPTSKLTAYSENKGKKIAFCLNKKKNTSELIDLNTLMFVAIHELSHIMTESVGHEPEFWANFKILLENAKEANIYDPQDYKKDPENYCGMQITDNPYFDM
jgi:hypothetical protein